MTNNKVNLTLWLIVVNGILTSASVSSDTSNVEVVTVQAGGDATLSCPSSQPDVEFQSKSAKWDLKKEGKDWFTLMSSSGDGVSISDKDRYDVTTADYSLTIHNVTLSDEGRYKCNVHYKLTNPTNGEGYLTVPKTVQLNVISPIDDLHVYSKSGDDAKYKTIVCEATNGKPPPSLYWKINGLVHDNSNGIQQYFDKGQGRTTTRSELTLFYNCDRESIVVGCIAKQNGSNFPERSNSTEVSKPDGVKAQTETPPVTSHPVTSLPSSSDDYPQIFHGTDKTQIAVTAICVTSLVIVILVLIGVMCWRRRVQRRAMEDYKDIENQPCLNQDKGEAAPNVCINNNNRATGDRKLCQAMVQKKADDTTTLLESPTSIIASPESGSDVTSDQTEATMGGYKYRSRRSRDSGYVEHISSSTELSSSEESNILEEMPTHEDDTTSTTSTVSSGTTSSEDSLSDRPLESGYSHAERGCEVSRADIEMGELLGEGRFGKVFKGRATLPGKSEHSEVAVKQLPACISAEEYKDLIRELDVMKKLKPHPRVVRLLASCTLPREDPIYVIVEYVSNGSLKNYLQKNRPVNSTYTSMTNSVQETMLTDKDLIKFALQVAEGMDYLHQNNCIHRDLAARNILVTSDINCKISDFGLARNIGPNQEYVTRAQGPLPLRWEAPESLISNVYNFKSDVWSYGILLWEIVTFGKRPYPDLDSCEDVRRKVKKGCTMAVPEHCHKGLRAVMQKCWQRDAQKRPSFDKIVSQLET